MWVTWAYSGVALAKLMNVENLDLANVVAGKLFFLVKFKMILINYLLFLINLFINFLIAITA
jgi:hypothetical protein